MLIWGPEIRGDLINRIEDMGEKGGKYGRNELEGGGAGEEG